MTLSRSGFRNRRLEYQQLSERGSDDGRVRKPWRVAGVSVRPTPVVGDRQLRGTLSSRPQTTLRLLPSFADDAAEPLSLGKG